MIADSVVALTLADSCGRLAPFLPDLAAAAAADPRGRSSSSTALFAEVNLASSELEGS